MALWNLEGSLDETKTIRKTPITHFPFVIGRSKSLDMVILRTGISREHAEIFTKDGRLFIRDLGSTNGTFVNKNRITTDTLITQNTVIHFAQVDFRLIDLEFKAPSDELLTVVINLDDIPELNARTAKGRDASKPLSPVANSSDAKRINKEKAAKPSDAVEFKKVDRKSAKASEPAPDDEFEFKKVDRKSAKASALAPDDEFEFKKVDRSSVKKPAPALASKAAPQSQRAHANLQHMANGKIFVQGGGDESNRRIHTRREAHWPTLVTLKNQQSVECMTKDLSETGLALKSPVSLKEQSLVKLDIKAFHKGRTQELTVLGVVKHSLLTADGFTVGIQMKSCSKSCGEFMLKFLKHAI